MNDLRSKTAVITRLACAAMLCAAAGVAQATVITFDDDNALSSNFTYDVFNGDSGTQFDEGYAAYGAYAGSNGGFVHFNSYGQLTSLQERPGAP
jgi:hypothetical protein